MEKPNFTYEALYEMRDEIIATLESGYQPNATELYERLETLEETINYLEEMDKDRYAETYSYELTLSQELVKKANEDKLNLCKIPELVIPDCDWNDSIPTAIRLINYSIKLDITISDQDEIIKIYATL